MSENVIKFQRPKQPKPPRRMPPWLRRLCVAVAVVAALVLIWTYFYVTGGGAPV